MVEDRLTDGVRIAELLASELVTFASVTDADPDVEPTAEGALAYAVRRTGAAGVGAEAADGDAETHDPDPVAEVYVHPDRVHVEFTTAHEAVVDAAREAGLRVRPAASRTIVFVADGAEVKRVRAAFEAALA